MAKVEINFSNEFIEELDSLTQILYEKGYFGFKESAELYVSDIYEFIEINISKIIGQSTPFEIHF